MCHKTEPKQTKLNNPGVANVKLTLKIKDIIKYK